MWRGCEGMGVGVEGMSGCEGVCEGELRKVDNQCKESRRYNYTHSM